MKFEIKDGLSIISIGLSEIGSYFKCNKPITAVWYDCRGSLGKYICQLPLDETYRNLLREKISENLNKDFTNEKEELYNLLQPIFRLFPNGEYFLNYYHSSDKKYFEYTSSFDNFATVREYGWFPVFEEPIFLKSTDRKKLEYKEYVEERIKIGQIYSDIVDFSTTGFYEGNYRSFIATQPKSEINEERVKFFENQISKGERPFIIVASSSFNRYTTNLDNTVSEYSINSENYVIDGHHKLLAYYNLKINPSIAFISHYPRTKDEIVFDIEPLIEEMYPWQIEHIIKNWDSRDEFIIKALNNPNSKIHNFIKNGLHKEYYENGQLKHEAFYINDRINGVSKGWFDNGQLEYQYLYENQIYKEGETWYKSGMKKSISYFRISFSEVYYESGQIQCKNELIDDNQIHFRQTWFENGAKELEEKRVLAGGVIMRKSFNQNGQVVNFEEYDYTQQKFVKKI